MTLREIFDGLPIQDSAYDGGLAVTGITYDSRKVRKGSLFVCIEGFITDGHRFAGQAASQGAVALLVQKPVDSVGCAWACVPDTRAALALVSKRFFQDPCSRMSVAGVTGTSGKTSVSFMLRSILEASGHRTGLIGPVANIFDGEESFAVRSTPESSDLLALLEEMAAAASSLNSQSQDLVQVVAVFKLAQGQGSFSAHSTPVQRQYTPAKMAQAPRKLGNALPAKSIIGSAKKFALTAPVLTAKADGSDWESF